jgi:hypothetical protein
MYKDKEKLKFHVFTDNKDDWKKTEKETRTLIRRWRKEGFKNFRVYTCVWNATEGIYDDVDCIYAIGSFPI